MPYKFETDHIILPEWKDRRVKLTQEDKKEIQELINKWLSNSTIWDMFWVHRKTIYLIRYPEQAKKEKEDFSLRRMDWRYYDKDKHTKQVREHRQYKKQILTINN